jgi:hypothetical protein
MGMSLITQRAFVLWVARFCPNRTIRETENVTYVRRPTYGANWYHMIVLLLNLINELLRKVSFNSYNLDYSHYTQLQVFISISISKKSSFSYYYRCFSFYRINFSILYNCTADIELLNQILRIYYLSWQQWKDFYEKLIKMFIILQWEGENWKRNIDSSKEREKYC